MIPLPRLAELAREPRTSAAPTCELCAAPLPDEHRHVVEQGPNTGQNGVGPLFPAETKGSDPILSGIRLLCACTACAVLFADGAPGAKYRTVGDRVRVDGIAAVELGLPVALSMWVRDSAAGCVRVRYPGPAGVVEGDASAEAWDALAAATPLAGALVPDIEALLVDTRPGRARCYLVPITSAFELAARLRRTWQGFTGGDDAQRELAAFFADLDARGGKR